MLRSGGCAKCKKDALYRIRAFETTYRLSRFNNTGSQVTVLAGKGIALEPATGFAFDTALESRTR